MLDKEIDFAGFVEEAHVFGKKMVQGSQKLSMVGMVQSLLREVLQR